MSWSEFAFIGIACAATILICRVVPVFALRGRDLPGWLSQALAFIPPAAFAALISNDLDVRCGLLAGGNSPYCSCCCYRRCHQDEIVGMVHRRRRRGFWSFASCLALLELLKALGFSGRLLLFRVGFVFLVSCHLNCQV